MNKASKIGAIVLAAGSSSRLGQPKQLVSYKGRPLLQHILDQTLQLNLVGQVVVLGSNHQIIKEEIDTLRFHVLQNDLWEEGMASSIRLGIEFAQRNAWDAVLILLSDQPHITSKHLKELIEKYDADTYKIISTKYDGILGVPALFDRSYFSELCKLEGDKGARKLINDHRKNVQTVQFELAKIDIDTMEDLEKLGQ